MNDIVIFFRKEREQELKNLESPTHIGKPDESWEDEFELKPTQTGV